MSNISEKLDENIERYLDEIAVRDVGDERSKRAIDAVVKLHKLRADELKLQNEKNELENKQIFETQKLSCDELARNEDEKERKKERWFKFGVAAAEIVLPLAVYGTLAFIGYAREFDGTVCSRTLQNIAGRIGKR